ncbi:MAG: hypothetical protein NWE96_03220 [Candidatus Bathyarchaeota archaeon]|nr:hypothetical protein [Candidatus Bathyarchaeota archaeon]
MSNKKSHHEYLVESSNKMVETEEKDSKECRDNSKDSFQNALHEISIHQERAFLNYQIILFVFVGAITVSILASAFFDFFQELWLANGLLTSKGVIDLVFIGLSAVISFTVYILFRRKMRVYIPSKPILTFLMTPKDTKPFVDDSRFSDIQNYLFKGNLQNFKIFGDAFFRNYSSWFPALFGEKIAVKQVYEEENYLYPDPYYKESFPEIRKEYDITQIRPYGVKAYLEVVLAPDVKHILIRGEGDKTAAYGFNLVFFLRIDNPVSPNASKFLNEFYLLYVPRVVKFSSYALDTAFKETGLPIKATF